MRSIILQILIHRQRQCSLRALQVRADFSFEVLLGYLPYEEPIMSIVQGRSTYWSSIWASAMAASAPHQGIITRDISGNARVLNVGGDHITHLNNALDTEMHVVLESIEGRLNVMHDAVLGMSISGCCIFFLDVLDGKIAGWLSAPDVSQNLNAALQRRQPGTGTWFLESAQFTEWKEHPNILLCIYGSREFPHSLIIPQLKIAASGMRKDSIMVRYIFASSMNFS